MFDLCISYQGCFLDVGCIFGYIGEGGRVGKNLAIERALDPACS